MKDAAPPIVTLGVMAKQSKKPADLNRLAAAIVGDATDEEGHHGENGSVKVPVGRNGGLKGGAARAAKLSPERRAEIARKAAKTRWQKARSSD
jgi:hypothetical protein